MTPPTLYLTLAVSFGGVDFKAALSRQSDTAKSIYLFWRCRLAVSFVPQSLPSLKTVNNTNFTCIRVVTKTAC